MDKKIKITVAVLIVLLGVSGFAVYRTVVSIGATDKVEEEAPKESVLPLDKSVKVGLAYSKDKDYTLVLTVSGLDGKMKSVAYELTYESAGLIKGVNSGSKPINLEGNKDFEREVYLGTCSRNVCTADKDVTKATLAMEFISADGTKYQYSKDFELE